MWGRILTHTHTHRRFYQLPPVLSNFLSYADYDDASMIHRNLLLLTGQQAGENALRRIVWILEEDSCRRSRQKYCHRFQGPQTLSPKPGLARRSSSNQRNGARRNAAPAGGVESAAWSLGHPSCGRAGWGGWKEVIYTVAQTEPGKRINTEVERCIPAILCVRCDDRFTGGSTTLKNAAAMATQRSVHKHRGPTAPSPPPERVVVPQLTLGSLGKVHKPPQAV